MDKIIFLIIFLLREPYLVGGLVSVSESRFDVSKQSFEASAFI